jgi:CheY-like chemotaxis protein
VQGQAKKVVLIVDDDRDVREVIQEVLEHANYEALAAANGKEALETLRSNRVKPCVILLDLMMPVMNGWQFRIEQQGDQQLSAIPVVVLSAHVNAEREASDMNAAALLKKPVQLRTLLSTVERFCGNDG